MRDINRIDDVLERIKKIWKQYPDLRLGQLLTNVVSESIIYFVEDDDLINALEESYE